MMSITGGWGMVFCSNVGSSDAGAEELVIWKVRGCVVVQDI